MSNYDLPLRDYRKGERIELHPSHPLRRVGARGGYVYGRGRKALRVKLDKLQHVQMIHPAFIRKAV